MNQTDIEIRRAASARGEAVPRKSRNTGIDLLRGVAVLLVANFHFQGRLQALNPGIVHPLQTFLNYYGWVGLDLFFVLSGFLVSGLLFQEFQKNQQISCGRFLIRRGFKIYPGFYAFLFFFTALTLLGFPSFPRFSWQRFFAEFFFVQNYFPLSRSHTWSLAVEEHFYISLAIGVYFLSRRDLLHRTTLFLALSIGAIALVNVLRLFNGLAAPTEQVTNDRFPLGSQYFLTHLRLDGLIFGVTLSYLYHFQRNQTSPFIRRWRWPLLVLGLALVGVVAPWKDRTGPFPPPSSQFWVGTIGFTLVYIGWGAVLMVVVTAPARLWANGPSRLLAWIGFYSYSTYLWHTMVVFVMIAAVKKSRLENWVCLGSVVYSFLAIVAGWAIARLVEIPMLAIRDRLFPSRS